MNVLIDQLPKIVTIDDIEYELNWTFHTSIAFEIMMQSDQLSDDEKIAQAIQLYYSVIPSDLTKAIEQLLWFYRCGQADQDVSDQKGNSSSAVYSFEHDDRYIYAAFLDQYGIDLHQTEMHWWTFRALFQSLKGDNEFVKIMSYRSIKITGDMTKEQRAFYRDMKKLHQIPMSKVERQRISAIESALMGDGKLNNIL